MPDDATGSLFRLTPEDSKIVVNECMLLDLAGSRSGAPSSSPEAALEEVIARVLASYPNERRLDLGWRWNGIARAFSKWGLPDPFGALDVRPGAIGAWMIGLADKARVAAVARDLATTDVETGIAGVDPGMPVRDRVFAWEQWRSEPSAVPTYMRGTLDLFARAARENETVLFVYA